MSNNNDQRIDYVELTVKDIQRSRDFYDGYELAVYTVAGGAE